MLRVGDDKSCSGSGEDGYVNDKGSSSSEPDLSAR